MLDDDAGRHIEGLDALPGGIGVADVVVGELLALQLNKARQRAGRNAGVTIEGGVLVRILAVAQIHHLGELGVEAVRERKLLASRIQRGQIVADGAVIFGSVRKGFLGQRQACFGANRTAAGFEFTGECGIIRWIGDDGDMAVVLGRCTHHGRAADIDVLDGFRKFAIRIGDGFAERVQVDHHHVDRRNICRLHGQHMFRQVAPAEDAAMDPGMQGLDAPVQHFREAGVVADLDHRHVVVTEQLGGTSGGKDFDTETVQGTGKFENALLVGNADQRTLDDGHVKLPECE
ncbi:hypothetical protein GALL_461190 [mine drainage metagenome]|uniref:Uncharacterized protein n=1 Tax=mine drainage metagenome TaxID=410659 RepID=A0A1J5PL40_9ZZZZ